ncbi:hypothetical protein [Falsiroseomonas sp. CW058]|uniref:hypothetical protein n=1 Tax=Falsiroseomonas sp. CW058 TaxID=3388664 RepID=UPI003D3206F4
MRLLLLPLLLLACADPAAEHLGGLGDPARGAALSGPWWGDTARLAGRPAQAARAAVQLEVIADSFETDPLYRHEVSGEALHAMRVGRRDMRDALGIAADAPPGPVIVALREAAAAIDAGSPARAGAALGGPMFRPDTLARLSRLPALPRVRDAAGAAWVEMRRLDGGGRG